MINGVEVDATEQQAQEITAFQQAASIDPKIYQDALQLEIDNEAMTKSYTNGFACTSYVTSTNPQWAEEAQAFVAWRDLAFAYGYDYLSKVQSGEIQNPTIDNFIAGIPTMDWPVVNP